MNLNIWGHWILLLQILRSLICGRFDVIIIIRIRIVLVFYSTYVLVNTDRVIEHLKICYQVSCICSPNYLVLVR